MRNFKRLPKVFVILAVAALMLGLFSEETFAQDNYVKKANYKLAAKFAGDKIDNMLFDYSVNPNWLENSDKFWYKYETPEGKFFYLVNPEKRMKKPVFDNAKMAAQLTEQTKNPYDPKHIPIETISFSEDAHFISFTVDSMKFKYELATETLTFVDSVKKTPEKPKWASFSPDSLTIIFARNHNLFMMRANDPDSVEYQLTTDGERFYSYAADADDTTKDKRQRVYADWSPNSEKFAMIRSDSRKVKELWVINTITDPRPTLETYKYAMPGEKNVYQYELLVFDRNKKTKLEIKADKYVDQSYSSYARGGMRTGWSKNAERYYFGRRSRDLKRYDYCVANTETGEVRELIHDEMNTYLELHVPHVINDGDEIIYQSERDGWSHFYLYDGYGVLKNRITSGPFTCGSVARIDTTGRVLYLTACGREEGEDPYYMHLYRVNFDGTDMQLLNYENADHQVDVCESAKYFVDNFSRVDMTPRSVLRNNEGEIIVDLETMNLSLLFDAGFKFPEPFKVKAADGITDIYGVMYKPFDFDPSKKYPIIAYVYPGPQTESVAKSFRSSFRNVGLAQFGFIVIEVGNRGGHPMRSKWYHNYGYGNLRDYGLADKKAAIEQLANRYSFINVDKVGIYGHSGGGFMSTAAMLVYPDFFKVAVSSSGNHDNNVYNMWWSEKHHGVLEQKDEEGNVMFTIKVPTNPELAANLKGRLFLVTGAIDNNVHHAGTYRVAEALIKANKRFDFFIFPSQRHGYGDMNDYFFWIRADYFCKHLIGDYEDDVNILYLKENYAGKGDRSK